MAERTAATADDPAAEAIATTGLFLNITAVIAVAVCVASLGLADATLAVASGIIAVVGFAVSIACFRRQTDEPDLKQVVSG